VTKLAAYNGLKEVMPTMQEETFGEMIKRYRAEDMAEYRRGRAAWAERTKEERALRSADRAGAAQGVAVAIGDIRADWCDNWRGILTGVAILAGSFWLAIQ